jgi:hypothetical protein
MRCLTPRGSAALRQTALSHPQPAIRLHGHARARRNVVGAQRRGGITQLSDIQVLKDLKTDGGDLDSLELRDVKVNVDGLSLWR